MEPVRFDKIYIETDGNKMKSLPQFVTEFHRMYEKYQEKAGKKPKEVKTKELGQKSYTDKIMCFSCKRDTTNRQPVKYYQSVTDSGSPRYSIKALCAECGKCKSKFIKPDDVPKEIKKSSLSKVK